MTGSFTADSTRQSKLSAPPRAPWTKRRWRCIPTVELLEDRRLLAVSLLQGTAFFDNNSNGVYDPANGDQPKVGATIELRSSSLERGRCMFVAKSSFRGPGPKTRLGAR